MIWYEGENHIVMSEYSGEDWSKKDTIVSGTNFFKNWADLPQIFQLGGDTLAISWLEMIGEGTFDYGINISLTIDRGKTWSTPIRPHSDTGKGEHGFVSFFQKPSGELGLIWLDGRYMGEYNLSTHTMGDMAVYTTGISTSISLEEEKPLDLRVCECCPTNAVEVPGGVLTAYRDRSKDEIRNINLIRFSHGEWGEPYTVYDDNWFIPGCPVNGPALASNGNDVVIVWYTAPDKIPIVNVAFSSDGGLSFGKPVRIDKGSPIGRTDVLWIDQETVLISWLEDGEDGGELILQSVNSINEKLGKLKLFPINSGRASGYPKLAKTHDYLFLTWTLPNEEVGIQTKWIPVGYW